MTKHVEAKLQKIGIPAGVAALMTVIVSLICQAIHA